MAGTTISTRVTTNITLGMGGYDSPLTVSAFVGPPPGSGGYVTVASGVAITGTYAGASVTNYGLIFGGGNSAGTGGAGVVLSDAGMLYNKSGYIRGGFGSTIGGAGAVLTGGTHSQGAHGLISGGYGSSAMGGAGVSLTNATFTNAGEVRGGGSHTGIDGTAIVASGSTITNSGMIYTNFVGTPGMGVSLTGSTLINNGTISGAPGVALYGSTSSLTNNATINGGASGWAVVEQGGYVLNASGAKITPNFMQGEGAEVYGGAQLVNNGVIALNTPGDTTQTVPSGATGGTAVLLQSGATFGNAGTIVGGTGVGTAGTGGVGVASTGNSFTNSGTIIGGAGAVSSGAGVSFSGGTLTNTSTGTITGGGAAQFVDVAGLGAAGVSTTAGNVSNAGAIYGGYTYGSAQAGGAGVYDKSGTVGNTGTIRGGSSGMGPTATGVYLGAGTLTNSGQIYGHVAAVLGAGAGNYIGNSGTLSGVTYGAYLDGAGKLANNGGGYITGAVGVGLRGGATLVNAAGEKIEGQTYGVNALGAATIDNLGTIKAVYDPGVTPGVGVEIGTGTTLTNGSATDSAAAISGAAGGGVVADGGSVTNYGTITGSTGVVVAGAGLTNAAGGAITGGGGAGGASLPGVGGAGGLGGAGVSLGGGTSVNNGAITGGVGGTGGYGYTPGGDRPGTGGAGGTGGRAVVVTGGSGKNYGTLTGGAGGAGGLGDFGVPDDGPGGMGGTGLYVSGGSYANDNRISGGAGGAGTALAPGGYGAVVAGGMLVNNGAINGVAGQTVPGLSPAVAGSIAAAVTGGYLLNAGSATGGAGDYGGFGVRLASGTLKNTGQITGGAGIGGFYSRTGSAGLYIAGGTASNAGTITGGADPGFAQGNAVTFAKSGAATLAVDPGAVFDGAVVANSAADDTLEFAGSGAGTLAMGSSFTGFSNIAFEPGTEWSVTGVTAAFADGAAITGFGVGDSITLSDFAATGYNFVPGTGLEISGSADPTLNFVGDYTQQSFDVVGTASSTIITYVACFARGTRIATPGGEVAVERLRAGDAVMTPGGARTVRWIGRRTIELARHADPDSTRPIRIAEGAFAEGVPSRDLFLSPDHAVFWDGHLVEAKRLVNGMTVTQAAPDVVTYFHVELAEHGIIFAEGLPAESYLDTGNRAMFENAQAGLGADRDKACCAPIVYDGKRLIKIRRHLLARARKLGHRKTRDPGLYLMVDGRRVEAQSLSDGRVRLAIPKGAREIKLASRHAIAREMLAEFADTRRLGACVARLQVTTPAGTRELPLDDAALAEGWHEAEEAWRWTDGEARLNLDGPCLLHVTLAGALPFVWKQARPRGLCPPGPPTKGGALGTHPLGGNMVQ